ncbi:MAG: DUF6057 family protein [Tannerellaceae bacterium]|nr:DUF6057 family protein [Tannerellaceae bacterium]
MQLTAFKYKVYSLLLFAVSLYLYFDINYKYYYHFMEQYVLFLYKKSYFLDLLVLPGGFNEYMAEFIIQFFYYPSMVGMILSFLIMGITFLFIIFIKRCKLPVFLPFVFIPAIIFCIFPFESIAILTAIIMTFGIAWGYTLISHKWVRYTVGTLLIGIVYFLLAPAHFLLAVLILVYEWAPFSVKAALTGVLWILFCFLLPSMALRFLYVIPLREAYFSKFLFHPEQPVPFSFYLVWISFPVILFFTWLLRRQDFITGINRKKSIAEWGCLVMLSIIGIVYGKTTLHNAYKYDYYVRTGQWEQIVQQTSFGGIKDINALVYLNLALSYTG